MIPGLTDNNYEIFVKNGTLYVLTNGLCKEFDNVDSNVRNYLQSFIDARAKSGFKKLKLRRFQQLKKFLMCRFGNIDCIPDFSGDQALSEYVSCSKRNKCPAAGLLCNKNHSIPGGVLTAREIEFCRLVALDLADKQIADQMGISYTTAVTHRRNIEIKLTVSSKVGIAGFVFKNNL